MRCNLGRRSENRDFDPDEAGRHRRVEPLQRLPAVVVSAKSVPSALSRVVFAPDGQLLAGGRHDGTVTVWDVSESKVVRSFGPLHATCGINDLTWASNSRHLFTAGSDGTAVCLDVTSAAPIAGRVTHHKAQQPSPLSAQEDLSNASAAVAAPSRFSRRLLLQQQAAGSAAKDAASDRGFERLRAAVTAVACPKFHGQIFLTGGFDEVLCQWDLRTFNVLNDVRVSESFISSLEFLHDGRSGWSKNSIGMSGVDENVCIVADGSGAIALYDVQKMEPLRTLGRRDGFPVAHAFSVNGGREICCIAVSSTPRLYDTLAKKSYWNLIPPPTAASPAAAAPPATAAPPAASEATETANLPPPAEEGAWTTGEQGEVPWLLDQAFLDGLASDAELNRQLEPRQPTFADPFVGSTPVEFLTANGPMVFGAAVGDAIVVPWAMRFLSRSTGYRAVMPSISPSAHLWNSETGKWVGAISRGPHGGADVTSVCAHPPAAAAAAEQRLFATSGAQPDCAVVLWRLI